MTTEAPPDDIQDIRDQILLLIHRDEISDAQEAMREIVDEGLSLKRAYDLASIAVPATLWRRLLVTVRHWEDQVPK